MLWILKLQKTITFSFSLKIHLLLYLCPPMDKLIQSEPYVKLLRKLGHYLFSFVYWLFNYNLSVLSTTIVGITSKQFLIRHAPCQRGWSRHFQYSPCPKKYSPCPSQKERKNLWQSRGLVFPPSAVDLLSSESVDCKGKISSHLKRKIIIGNSLWKICSPSLKDISILQLQKRCLWFLIIWKTLQSVQILRVY